MNVLLLIKLFLKTNKFKSFHIIDHQIYFTREFLLYYFNKVNML